MRRKTESNLDKSMSRNFHNEFKLFQDRESGKGRETGRKFFYYQKHDHNLSPKISLSKTNNPILDDDHRNHHRKKIYTEHDNQHHGSMRPSYYQCATDRTPNTSNNRPLENEKSFKKAFELNCVKLDGKYLH